MKRLAQPGDILRDDDGDMISIRARKDEKGVMRPEPLTRAGAVLHLTQHQRGMGQEEALNQHMAGIKLRDAATRGDAEALLEDAEHECLGRLVTQAYSPDAQDHHMLESMILNCLALWLRSAETVPPEALRVEKVAPAGVPA